MTERAANAVGMGRWGGAAATVSVVVTCAMLGAVLGLASMLVHREAVRVSGVPLPWGVALGWCTTYAVIVALRLTPLGARGSAACGAGWVLLVLAAQRSRPEGDFLVAGDGLGTVFLLGGLAVVAVAVVRSRVGAPAPPNAGRRP